MVTAPGPAVKRIPGDVPGEGGREKNRPESSGRPDRRGRNPGFVFPGIFNILDKSGSGTKTDES
jgi:hypothetical protein